MVYSFARTAITKYHRLGGLNYRSLFSQSSGGLKFKVKVLTVLVFPEASLLGLQMAAFSSWSFLGRRAPLVSLPLFIRTPVIRG